MRLVEGVLVGCVDLCVGASDVLGIGRADGAWVVLPVPAICDKLQKRADAPVFAVVVGELVVARRAGEQPTSKRVLIRLGRLLVTGRARG